MRLPLSILLCAWSSHAISLSRGKAQFLASRSLLDTKATRSLAFRVPKSQVLAYQNQNPVLSKPLTSFFIGSNIFTFLLQKANPMITQMGARITPNILSGGEYYRLITPLFLHGDIFHLLVNCYSMYNCRAVEQIFGPKRFLLTYFVSGIAGNLLGMAVSPNTMSIGASGAVFGLVGALGTYIAQNKKYIGPRSQVMLDGIYKMIGFNVLYGLTASNIDNAGHMGGLLGGALVAYLIGPRFVTEWKPRRGGWVVRDSPRLQSVFTSIGKKLNLPGGK